MVLLAAALVSVTGCSGEPQPPEANGPGTTEPVHGGTLVSGLSTDIGGVNELVTPATVINNAVLFRLFLHLLEEQPDVQEHPPTFAPHLARSYEWSEDHKVLTFHLRDDVFWSDGVPVTAEDVRWTWQAQTHPEVAWDTSFVKEAVDDVEVVDPHTVRFHFNRVYPAQLLDANEGVILPKHAWSRLPFSEWRRNGNWFVENIVTNGPFRLEGWKPEEEIVLARNENYFEPGIPYLDRVVFRIISDQSSQVTQLRAGALDFVSNVPPDDALGLARTDGLVLKDFWSISFIFIAWNNESPLFEDSRVRRALTMGIDRQGIVEGLWSNFAVVADSPIPQSVWAHNDDIEPYPYDPQEARRLLAEAGWKDTDGDGILDKDGRPFRFEILNHTGNRQREDATLIAQEQLRRLGIEAIPRILELASFIAALSEGEYEAAMAGMNMPTDLNMRYFFHSDQIGNGLNHSRYRNPEVDQLIEAAYEQPEPADMAPYLMRLQEILHEDQPLTFLWFSKRLNAHQSHVRNVQANIISPWYGLRYWWTAPH